MLLNFQICEKLAEVDEEAQDPDIWSDQERAREVMQRRSQLQQSISMHKLQCTCPNPLRVLPLHGVACLLLVRQRLEALATVYLDGCAARALDVGAMHCSYSDADVTAELLRKLPP